MWLNEFNEAFVMKSNELTWFFLVRFTDPSFADATLMFLNQNLTFVGKT